MRKWIIRHGKAILTVVQGLLLLVILSTLFSSGLYLTIDAFSVTQEKLEQIQANNSPEVQQALQDAAPVEEIIDEQEAYLEAAKQEQGSIEPVIIMMYAAFSLLFLIRALITRGKRPLNLYRYGIGFLLFAACAALFVLNEPERVYTWVAVFHVLALSVDHVFSMINHHKARNLVTRIMFILVLASCFLLLIISGSMALLYILILTIPRIFYYISRIAFSQVKMDILRRILRKTYAAEILFGMLLLIIAFSIVLPQFEYSMTNFGDALWYCFAIVTTIGFGDFTAVTVPGRIISAVLGFYGIIVVALITSIIVNFYSETKNTADDDGAEPEDAMESL